MWSTAGEVCKSERRCISRCTQENESGRWAANSIDLPPYFTRRFGDALLFRTEKGHTFRTLRCAKRCIFLSPRIGGSARAYSFLIYCENKERIKVSLLGRRTSGGGQDFHSVLMLSTSSGILCSLGSGGLLLLVLCMGCEGCSPLYPAPETNSSHTHIHIHAYTQTTQRDRRCTDT